MVVANQANNTSNHTVTDGVMHYDIYTVPVDLIEINEGINLCTRVHRVHNDGSKLPPWLRVRQHPVLCVHVCWQSQHMLARGPLYTTVR